jgi:hypothetical protein
MTKKLSEDKDRKGYSFTLHLEEDKDLIEFLEKNKVTKSVKKGLRLLMEQEKKQEQIENLNKEQLLAIISLLSQNINLNSILPLQNQQIAAINQEKDQKQVQETNQETEEEIDEETMEEYQKIVKELGGKLGSINL